jgi:hypothetical protein
LDGEPENAGTIGGRSRGRVVQPSPPPSKGKSGASNGEISGAVPEFSA